MLRLPFLTIFHILCFFGQNRVYKSKSWLFTIFILFFKVTLTCTSTESNPISYIEWLKNGQKINPTGEEVKESQDVKGYISLSFIAFNLSHLDDQTKVICLVKNKFLNKVVVQDEYVLNVLCKLIITYNLHTYACVTI